MLKLERRFVSVSLRMEHDDGDGCITGYAANHYNGDKKNQSLDLGGFRERLSKGCFTRALAKGGDVKCLFNHDSNLILGRIANGSLNLASDDRGLLFRCDLGKQSYAQDLRESIRTGLINQCSFGFIMDDDPDSQNFEWDDDGEGEGRYLVRNIHNVHELTDVSPVTSPAYPATQCSARQLWPDGEPAAVLRALGHDKEALFAFQRQRRNEVMRRVMQ
jgi:uncharacterized protein